MNRSQTEDGETYYSRGSLTKRGVLFPMPTGAAACMNAGYAMGGQMEQNAAVQHHLHHHNNNHAAAASDSGDAVMARWLQSAGLQHLAAPLAAAALDHRLLPSLLMQVPPILLQPS